MKHLQSNQDFRFNEVLFEGRNKQYGAYVLRNESDRILTKALFIGVSLLAAISITPMIISAFKTAEPVTDGGYVLPPPVFIPDDPIVKPPVKIEPVKATPPPSVKQYNAEVVIPKRDANEDNIVKDIPKDAVAGVKNDFISPPAAQNTYVPPTAIPGNGPVINQVQPPVNVIKDPKAIDKFPAVQASFEGGIDSFRKKVMNKFDTSAFEDQNSVATVVTFIVETDGTISDVKTNGKDATFNAEALRTIKTVKGKWIPGKNKDGDAVRSYFKFPISMRFDN